MYQQKITKIFLLISNLCISPFAFSQDISTSICQVHEYVMMQQVLPYRKQGALPVGEAENLFNDEDDVRTRVFLKQYARQLYADPTWGEKTLRSGQFKNTCIKINRGY